MAKHTTKRSDDRDEPPEPREERYDPAEALPPEKGGAPGGVAEPPPPGARPEVADPGGPVPRIVKPLERAPAGLKRYKIRSDNYGGSGTRYILARNEDEARVEYLKQSGMDKAHEKAKKAAAKPDEVSPPDLVVVELPD